MSLKRLLPEPNPQSAGVRETVLLIPVGYPAPGAQVPVIEKKTLEEVVVVVGEAIRS